MRAVHISVGYGQSTRSIVAYCNKQCQCSRVMDIPWFHHTPCGMASPWFSSCSIPFSPQDLLDGYHVSGTGQGTVKKIVLQPSSVLIFPCLQPWNMALLPAVPWLLPCHAQHLREFPDTSNSFSRFQQSSSSCSYILMSAVLLLAMQAALVWTTTVPLTWGGASG